MPVLMTIALYRNLKSSMIPPGLFFILRISPGYLNNILNINLYVNICKYNLGVFKI